MDKLRIQQRFRVDGVEVERGVVFYREGGAVVGRMNAWSNVEGRREAYLRRLLAYCEAVGLTLSLKPKEKPIQLEFTRKDLEALAHFREITEIIRQWLMRWRSAPVRRRT